VLVQVHVSDSGHKPAAQIIAPPLFGKSYTGEIRLTW
jgi:hypothetical protein